MYQVWTKGDEYSGWARQDCKDWDAAEKAIWEAFRSGKDPVLTQELPIIMTVKLGKETTHEAKKSEAEPDKVAGAESHGKVRRGDKAAAPGLDKGSGDNSPGPGAGN